MQELTSSYSKFARLSFTARLDKRPGSVTLGCATWAYRLWDHNTQFTTRVTTNTSRAAFDIIRMSRGIRMTKSDRAHEQEQEEVCVPGGSNGTAMTSLLKIDAHRSVAS
jgi:hypothetical protein